MLAGALAAGNRARTHDAVVLKTLGATRATLIRAFSYEYMILGVGHRHLRAFGRRRGSMVHRQPYHAATLQLSCPDVAGLTIVIALVMTVGIGLIGTWRILGQKAAPVLREL